MRYKSKHDIKLKDFLELFEGNDQVSEIIRIFSPNSVDDFSNALNEPVKPKWHWRRREFQFKKAGRFVDLDTLLNEGNTLGFLRILLPKWQSIKNISLAKSEHYVRLFTKAATEIKENHPYIYNPPLLPMSGDETQGSIERNEFVNYYGGYMEMTYLIAKGDFSKFDSILDWDLSKYLFFGEYLLRKRRVENIK